jgi:hypothetical protein
MYEIGDEPPYLAVSGDSQFANGQVTYKDGPTSPVQKIMRAK